MTRLLSSPVVCPRCNDLRCIRVPGQPREVACPVCAAECPECEGFGCVRGEEGPDPCNVCAGVGFALRKKTK